MVYLQPEDRPTPETIARARELRHNMTPQERKLWARLRAHQLCGLHFRRQHPVGRFIVDFYCDAQGLAIELDGHSHGVQDQQMHDQQRTEWLQERGIRVIRFTNADVDRNLEEVLRAIARQCQERSLDSSL